MATCTQCGSELTAGARFCAACGQAVPEESDRPVQAFPGGTVVHSPPTDGQAVAALVLGILGLVMCPVICSIIAIILGKISQRKIEESGGTLGGLGMAKAGWILGIIGVVVGILWIVIFAAIFIGAIMSEGGFDSSPIDAPVVSLSLLLI
jgi:hypothetical protein